MNFGLRMLVNLAEMLKRWSNHPENQKNGRGSLLIRKTKLSSINTE